VGRKFSPRSVLVLLRARQWVKNVFVFAPLVFAGRFGDPQSVMQAAGAFVGFCFLSSASYVINDIADAEEDRQHPQKKSRPIASGLVTKTQGALVAGLFLVLGAAVCVLVNVGVLVLGLSYFGVNLLYTFWLRRDMLLDVMCIAFGFLLRTVAGGVAVGVPVSLWLMACTFALCMFLGFGKRWAEVAQVEGGNREGPYRITLARYNLALLSQLLSVSAGVAIVTYILYTVDPQTVEKLGSPYLFFSVPLVIYCIFRYVMLVEAGKASDPTETVTRDWPFIAVVFLWSVYVMIIVRWGRDMQGFLDKTVGPLLQK